MPEMTFTVRWPDGTVDDCYSPSLVMHDHLAVGATYAVRDFVARSSVALGIASDRVRAKFGFACSASDATREHLEAVAARFDGDATVEVLAMLPPLPKVAR